MIRGFADQAANERTFLAWVRTGIAVIALGFVIEKFKLFLLALSESVSPQLSERLQLSRLSGPLGHYGGVALVYGGLLLIVIATLRFVRTSMLLAEATEHTSRATGVELALLTTLIIFIAGFAAFVAVG